MAVQTGNKAVGAVYYGSTPVKAVYKGGTLLWQKKPDNIMVLTYSDGTVSNVEVSGELTMNIVRSGGNFRSLVSAVIPSSVTSLEEYAFDSCSKLTNVFIPDSVTAIEGFVFSGCSSLTNVVIPDSVTKIEGLVFSGCDSLTGIEIPASVTSIKNTLFARTPGLTSIVVASDNPVYEDRGCNCIIRKADNTLIAGSVGTVIPSSVTSIDNESFYGNTGLTSINIPTSVTGIGIWAFWGCTNLTAIYCGFSEGAVTGAPWSAANATVYYDWSEEQAALLAAAPMTLDLYGEECSHPNLNERCYCPDCRKYQHVLDEDCKCKCGYEQHSPGEDTVCTVCGTLK